MRIEVLHSETLTVTNAVKTLTASFLTSPVNKVNLYVEAQTIRYWRSGKAPTATEGLPLFDGDTISFGITDATNLKMIRKDGVDAKVHVEYIVEHTT